ncbi:acetyltransferase [Algoriphagus sp. D3-2-R+10]|uniref:acetyltransferase n=1 Tax=Algoriphagus aurantiacus TaxID=3103948 RepID=UPI002B380E36|nr:acetyltransferase [Algoriphagus sp. D3-2-R+10]MEB2777502.1 acetyltransferase [Algoriphagus sp. D3-2-R+10]
MVIAGAGGHALEIFDELKCLKPGETGNGFICYDEDFSKLKFKQNISILHTEDELKQEIPDSFRFCLGVGNPRVRKRMIGFLEQLGGIYFPIESINAVISESSLGVFDALNQSFIGPNVKIGLGSLINVGAKIHHEVSLGEFVEIGPGSLILGNVTIGDFTQIGAGVVILPGVKVGENCIIGAGSVVTRNIEDGVTAYGVPCKIIIQ